MIEKREFSKWEALIAAPLVKKYEGLRLEAYLCPAGVPTIGYGHTKGVTLGMRIEAENADKLLSADLYKFRDEVAKLITVPVTKGQFIAILGFVYNLGVSKFKTSTLLRKLNLGDYRGAAEEFPKWCFANGQKLQGLLTRRKAEQRLFKEEMS